MEEIYCIEIYYDVRFPEGQVYEDLDIFGHIIDRRERTYVLNEHLYKHRFRKGSITDAITCEKLNDWLLAQTHHYEFLSWFAPSVIPYKKLMNIKRERINGLLSLLMQCLAERSETAAVVKESRAHIIREVKDIGLKRLGLRIQVAYVLLRISSAVLRYAVSMYRYVRKTIRR